MQEAQKPAISLGACKNTRNRNHRGTKDSEFHREACRWLPPVADFVCCLFERAVLQKKAFSGLLSRTTSPLRVLPGWFLSGNELVLRDSSVVFVQVDEVHGRKGRSFIGNIFLRNRRPFR